MAGFAGSTRPPYIAPSLGDLTQETGAESGASSSSDAGCLASPETLVHASRISDDSAQVSLPVAVEDLVLLEVSTKPNPLALNVTFGFDHKPLTLTRPPGAPVACGCTMAHLFFRIRDPFRLGDKPKSQQDPENSEVTCLLLGALPPDQPEGPQGNTISQRQRGDGTGSPVAAIPGMHAPERAAGGMIKKGSVWLKPEFFWIDWLHDHVTGNYDELKDLQRDLSIHVTALLHKAQRSQKLNRPILIPEVESDER